MLRKSQRSKSQSKSKLGERVPLGWSGVVNNKCLNDSVASILVEQSSSAPTPGSRGPQGLLLLD